MSNEYNVKGKRTEGTILKVPVPRLTPKSEFLLKLEAAQALKAKAKRARKGPAKAAVPSNVHQLAKVPRG